MNFINLCHPSLLHIERLAKLLCKPCNPWRGDQNIPCTFCRHFLFFILILFRCFLYRIFIRAAQRRLFFDTAMTGFDLSMCSAAMKKVKISARELLWCTSLYLLNNTIAPGQGTISFDAKFSCLHLPAIVSLIGGDVIIRQLS